VRAREAAVAAEEAATEAAEKAAAAVNLATDYEQAAEAAAAATAAAEAARTACEAEAAAAAAEAAASYNEAPARLDQGSSSSAAEAPVPREEEPPHDFTCPITTEVMTDPVMAADGHSYERSAMERWFATKSTSPLTGEELDFTRLFPNHTLRRQIGEWHEAHAGR